MIVNKKEDVYDYANEHTSTKMEGCMYLHGWNVINKERGEI